MIFIFAINKKHFKALINKLIEHLSSYSIGKAIKMDKKKLTYLQLFSQMAKIEITDTIALKRKVQSIVEFNYDYGIEAWEFLIESYEDQINADNRLAECIGNGILGIFYENNAQKTLKIIKEVPAISRTVFMHNPLADKDLLQVIVAEWLMGAKYDAVEFAFSLLQKNKRIEFGNYITIMVGYAISETIENCKANGNRIAMPRKMSELLLKFVARLKGPDKALLQQRIKEVN